MQQDSAQKDPLYDSATITSGSIDSGMSSLNTLENEYGNAPQLHTSPSRYIPRGNNRTAGSRTGRPVPELDKVLDRDGTYTPLPVMVATALHRFLLFACLLSYHHHF